MWVHLSILLKEEAEMKQSNQLAKAPNIVSEATVLLVEDDDSVRKWEKFALVSLGFTVFQAKDGVEAVNIFMLHKDENSCVLCDFSMPRMGGWETISTLRALRHDLPVVLTSGYDEENVMAGTHSELPDFFLGKPYDINMLGDIIGHAMAHKALTRQTEKS
jgi:CheY-like chemotaxis protein